MRAMRWPLYDDHNQQLASKEYIVLRALALVYEKWRDNVGEKDETEFEFGDGQVGHWVMSTIATNGTQQDFSHGRDATATRNRNLFIPSISMCPGLGKI